MTLTNATGMGLFSKMVFLYLLLIRTQNVFEVPSRKEDYFVSRLQANDLAKGIGPVSERAEVAAEVWDRSAAVHKAL